MATLCKRKLPSALLALLLAIGMLPRMAPAAFAEPGQEERGPTLLASCTAASPGDEVVFTVQLPALAVDPNQELVVQDELPQGATPLSIGVRAGDDDVTEVAGSASIEGQTARFSFDASWLQESLRQDDIVTLEISAMVDPLEEADGQNDDAGITLENTAVVCRGEDETPTNAVLVAVTPAPLQAGDDPESPDPDDPDEAPSPTADEPVIPTASMPRLLAAGAPQAFHAQPVATNHLFTGGYYLQSAGSVPVALTTEDIQVYNGGIESAGNGAIVVRDYSPSYNGGGVNFWVSALYRNYGDLVNADTGERTAVDVKTTIIPRATCETGAVNEWNTIVGTQYSREYAYVIFYTPGMGMKLANMPIADQKWEFFKAGTDEPVNVDGELWIMQQSLDMGEGFSAQNVTSAYVTSSMPNRNDQDGDQGQIGKIAPSSLRSVIPGSNVYDFTQTNWVDASDGTWSGLIGATIFTDLANGGRFRWAEPGEDDLSQDLSDLGLGTYKNTHLWASGSLKVAMNGGNELTVRNYEIGTRNWPKDNPGSLESAGISRDRDQGRYVGDDGTGYYGMKYLVTYFTTLTGFVPGGPSKSVDKTTARGGDTLTYTVKQPIGSWGSDLAQGTTYERLEFTDELPAQTEYVEGSLKVSDTTGRDVTNHGTTATSGQTLSFAFDGAYLADGLAYDGGDITFTFKVKVAGGTPGGTELVNEAVDNVNDYSLKSNPVSTVIVADEYYVPVKAVDKAEADVGEVVSYTITQKVHAQDERPGGNPYSAFTFSDELPAGLTYQPGSFDIVDSNGVSLLSDSGAHCQEAYGISGAGSLEAQGQVLTFAFNDEYLARMPYNGKDITFRFSGTVDDGAAGRTLVNDATTTVNASTQTSNEVTTVVPEPIVVPEPVDPVKQVDKTKAKPGDNLAYTVKQAVGELPDGRWYAQLAFADELPDGATPQSLKVFDTKGKDVTAEAGVAAIEGQQVTYVFSEAWLRDSLGNQEGTLTFGIDARIDSGDPERYGGKLVNDATLDFGGGTVRRTNKVTTVVEAFPVPLPLTGMAGVAASIALASAALALGLGGIMLVRRKAIRGRR